jgi:hypothetical protein
MSPRPVIRFSTCTTAGSNRTPAQVLNHRALGHEYDVLDPPARGRKLVRHHWDAGET